MEARREESGNAALSGRELAVEDALTAKNSVWAEAAALRNAGLDVSLREARTIVYLDRLRGLDPWERLNPPYDPPGSDGPDDSGGPADADDSDNADDHDENPNDGDDTGRFPDYGYGEDENGDEDEDGEDGDEDRDEGDDGGDGGFPGGPGSGPLSGRPSGPAGRAPLPALTNILISAGTLLGWSDAPAEVSGFGLIDPEAARDLIAAASQHPRSRWCVTIVGEDGEAIAHGCTSGPHPWSPPAGNRDGPAQLAGLLRQLGITLAPIAKGECDHRHREDRYRPARKLQHLIRARTATCPAPGCAARAIYNEIDHTVPWPAGTTDECDLSPRCNR